MKSEATTLLQRARGVLPGGVCSSTRYNAALGGPMYVAQAEGARFTDVDGDTYIDMCCGHGAALLGHKHPALVKAVTAAAERGFCSAFDTADVVNLAGKLCDYLPCAERVRFTNSGSEATLHALRLCRAFTGRDKLIRFTGHFHGYHEHTYIGGHPPAEALAHASTYRESAGIPEAFTQFIVALPFNDLAAVEAALREHADEIAVVILEPFDFNSGGIPPQPGFLAGLRKLTRQHGVLLFFDEIQSSFKQGLGGAQAAFGVTPDICTIGKALGGGLPLSAICGHADIMDRFKPVGDVQHSGTFNAPLLNVLAGAAFCAEAESPEFYPHLEKIGARFYEGVDGIVRDLGLPIQVPRFGARFGLMLGLDDTPVDYRDALRHRRDLMLEFVRQTARRGVYFHDYGGAPCHHGFSVAHTVEDIDRVLEVLASAFAAIKDGFAQSARA
ncbi:MAG: aspartate aminotransferase family protein [Opitutaceae bacterium]|nr:aspartate aminotransferase family protein [Cephaloticoccus sp.]MCP5530151.1 aspartate aminotransferase family protein [Opitutaceae bacterium]